MKKLVNAILFVLIFNSNLYASEKNKSEKKWKLGLGLGLGASIHLEQNFSNNDSFLIVHEANFFIGGYLKSTTLNWHRSISDTTYFRLGSGYYQFIVADDETKISGLGFDIAYGSKWQLSKEIEIRVQWIGLGIASFTGVLDPVIRLPQCIFIYTFN